MLANSSTLLTGKKHLLPHTAGWLVLAAIQIQDNNSSLGYNLLLFLHGLEPAKDLLGAEKSKASRRRRDRAPDPSRIDARSLGRPWISKWVLFVKSVGV